MCNGRTGYTSRKLDEIIDSVVHNLLSGIIYIPKDTVVAKRYIAKAEEYKNQLNDAKGKRKLYDTGLLDLDAESIKVIRGESKLDSGLLNKLYEDAKKNAFEADLLVRVLKSIISDNEKRKSLSKIK